MKYLILLIVATLLVIGCVVFETMALIVSTLAILFYSVIVAVFVYPSWESIEDVDKKSGDGDNR
jgi:membrane protein implicated in regulation of membrane protease activity